MNKRLITAAIGLVLLAGLLTLGGLPLRVAVIMITLLSMMELKGTLGSSYRLDDFLSAIFVVFSFFLPWDLALGLGFLYVVVSLVLSFIMSPLDLRRTQMNTFAYFFVLVPFMLLYRLMAFSPIKHLYLLAFVLAWGSDTFAYYVGSILGKTHYTEISPNKTLEGALGGLLGGILLIFIVKAIWIPEISFLTLLFFGLIGGFFAQLGDFMGSYIKRSCKVKDFGIIMPGHGGLLDRFISVMFTSVILYMMHNFF